VFPALPFPLVGSSGEDGARHTAQTSPVRVPVPAPVLRGVGLATAATVAVTGGAVALTGAAPEAPPGQELTLHTRAAAVPVPSPVAAVVPEPRTAPTTAVLDTGLLSDAVARAQTEARRLADDARATEQAREAQERVEADDSDDDSDDRRTTEQARRVGRLAEPDPEPAAAADCELDTGQLGAVKPSVRTAATFLGCAFDQPTVLGVAGRSSASDHPRGRALDFMVDRATGDELAACAIRNREELGISYVIWRQRIDTGSGFRPMPDRGGATANHFDHVHISFKPGSGTGSPASC
jgi:hypothetical protein